MAMKRKNLPEVVPELFEHEQFGQFRYIKRDEEIWFVAVDLCRALDIQNIRQNLANFHDDEKADVCITYTSSNGVKQRRNVLVVTEPGFYRLIFMSRKPEAENFKCWVFHEVLPSIRKYGFYRVQQPEQEKIYVEITCDKYFKLFKEKYPEINFGKALYLIGFTKILDGLGGYWEEDVFYLKLNPDDYEKLRRDILSLRCLKQTEPRKKRKSIGIRPTIHVMASES